MRLLFPYLALLGAIPFVACSLCLVFGIEVISLQDIPVLNSHNINSNNNGSIEITNILSIYGIVIASFMAGSHWGNHLQILALEAHPNTNSESKSESQLNKDVTHQEHLYALNDWSRKLPFISNIIAIGLWLGYLLQPTKDFYLLLLISFLVMLVVDVSLKKISVISNEYFKIRCLVTAIVSFSLVLAIISI